MKIVNKSISKLKAANYNPRVITKEARARLGASIEKFGIVQPIVWNKRTGNVVGGHQRLAVLQEKGVTEVKVVEVDLDEGEEIQLNLVMNNPHAQGEFDFSKLESLSLDLAALDVPVLDMEALGLSELFKEFEKPSPPPDAPAPPAPRVAKSKRGELWVCGRHRVLCGDSTSVEDVGRLMEGRGRADLVFTSPPYAQQRDYTEEQKSTDWDVLMQGVFGSLASALAGDVQLLVNLGLVHRDCEWIPYWENWIGWMRKNGWRRFGWYVWDQGPGLPGDWNGRLAPSFEFVWHFNKESKRPAKWIATKAESQKSGLAKKKKCRAGGVSKGMRGKDGVVRNLSSPEKVGQSHKIPDNVLRIQRECGNSPHPAVFPIALPTFIIKSWPGLILDPFLGSGTTLIAAEQLGRTCCGLELEPTYIDVILTRYANLTGDDPVREDGMKWSELNG